MKSLYLAGLALLTAVACNQPTGKGKDLMDSTKAALTEKWDPIAPDTQALKKYTRVEINTDLGRLELALFDATPVHRDNFLKLVKSGFYNGTLFHRIIKDFMVQGGDPDSRGAAAGKVLGEGGPGYELPAEMRDTLYHFRGALAAAREGDERNPARKSSGSQFYIVQGNTWKKEQWNKYLREYAFEIFSSDPENLSYQMRYETYQQRGDQMAMAELKAEIEGKVAPIADSLYNAIPRKVKQMYATWGGTPFLDKNYTVFGFLISGYDVLDKMSKVETRNPGQEDRPVKDVRIISARVID